MKKIFTNQNVGGIKIKLNEKESIINNTVPIRFLQLLYEVQFILSSISLFIFQYSHIC